MKLDNNILAAMAILLILFSILSQIIVYKKTSEIETPSQITGKATATVSLAITGTPQGVGFTAKLANDNQTIILSWNNQSQDNVSIYYTDNYSAGFGAPNITGLTALNWTDAAAGSVQQRFYKLKIFQLGTSYFANNTVGKYDIPIRFANGNPANYELNQISFPLIPFNNTVEDIARWSRSGDIILRFNTSEAVGGMFEGWETNIKMGGTWIKNFETFSPLEGYVFINVIQPYNLTIVGKVPTGQATIPMHITTGSPGAYEMMLLGWNSLTTNCNLSVALNTTTDANTVLWFNTTDQGVTYAGWETYLQMFGNWFPANGCMYPGIGYRFASISNAYNWTYDKS